MLATPVKKNISWRLIAVASMLTLFAVLVLNRHFASAAHSDSLQWRGIVDLKPADGFIGTWTIAGRDFEADGNTEIDQENGTLAIGSCADVDFSEVGGVDRADRIQSKPMSECDGSATASPSPSGTVTPDGTETKTPEASETPEITITPTGTGQPTGTVTPQPSTTPSCNDDSGGGGDNLQHDGGGDGCKIVGRITSFPAQGFVGIWGIDNVSYTVTVDTNLETEHGMFVENACVKVEFRQNANERIAKEIKTERAYRCDGHMDDEGRHEGKMYGVIESFPLSATGTLTGEWKVGGITFIANESTEFKQKKQEFAVGVVVKVKFWTDMNGVNYAKEIEAKFKPEDDGDDDDHDGSHDGAEGMAAGKISSIPENGVGVWVIGGIEYVANSDTELEEENGELKVDVTARVRYHEGANGERIADNIKTVNTAGQPGEDAHLTGAVEIMPATGFSGTWQIANVTFATDANSRFEEERGVLAVGAYVEVEYVVKEGVNIIVELKTQVPPGAGDNDDVGKIEKNDDNLSAAGTNAVRTWTIGGKSFVVNNATVLDNDAGAISVGNMALVNSYTAADGTQVATVVQGITLDNQVYLPTIQR